MHIAPIPAPLFSNSAADTIGYTAVLLPGSSTLVTEAMLRGQSGELWEVAVKQFSNVLARQNGDTTQIAYYSAMGGFYFTADINHYVRDLS